MNAIDGRERPGELYWEIMMSTQMPNTLFGLNCFVEWLIRISKQTKSLENWRSRQISPMLNLYSKARFRIMAWEFKSLEKLSDSKDQQDRFLKNILSCVFLANGFLQKCPIIRPDFLTKKIRCRFLPENSCFFVDIISYE